MCWAGSGRLWNCVEQRLPVGWPALGVVRVEAVDGGLPGCFGLTAPPKSALGDDGARCIDAHSQTV